MHSSILVWGVVCPRLVTDNPPTRARHCYPYEGNVGNFCEVDQPGEVLPDVDRLSDEILIAVAAAQGAVGMCLARTAHELARRGLPRPQVAVSYNAGPHVVTVDGQRVTHMVALQLEN